jgi:metallophosphoesterase (TIGR00282 family)
MTNTPDFAVPFTEKRDSSEIHRIPYYEDTAGLAPAGALISNIEDISHWLSALMGDGKYLGKQVLPADVLKATLQPAIALQNVRGETRGFWEVLNPAYGMGRQTAAYRGHQIAYHGGALGGFFSQISYMPQDHIGVIVLVIGEHCSSLTDVVTYNAYERLLGMNETPWSQRLLDIQKKSKQAETQARAKAGAQCVPDTKPSHPLEAYVGEYENPAYGVLKIGIKKDQLQYDFHKVQLPLIHFHYDRFDTPDDELEGKSSVNFLTGPLGDVEKATMSLDQAEVTFVRKPESLDSRTLQQLAGDYQSPSGAKFPIALKEDGSLWRVTPGAPEMKLLPYKGLKFRTKEFSDRSFEFVLENGSVVAMKEVDPAGELVPKLRERHGIGLVVANGENSAGGSGITVKTASEIFAGGVDIITSGDHLWDQKEVMELLQNERRFVRPLNYPTGTPGQGSVVVEREGMPPVGIMNLQGRTFMPPLENPFHFALAEVERLRARTNIIIVDFHAEATSEKIALARLLDGRVSAVIGTHTHVQTADEQIFPGGTAFLCDAGFTGPHESVIGRAIEPVVQRFMTCQPQKFEVAEGRVLLQGAVVEIDESSGRALGIERMSERLKVEG